MQFPNAQKTALTRQIKRDKCDFSFASWKRLKEEQSAANMYRTARSGVVLYSSALHRHGF